jgi:hypothetical protein
MRVGNNTYNISKTEVYKKLAEKYLPLFLTYWRFFVAE